MVLLVFVGSVSSSGIFTCSVSLLAVSFLVETPRPCSLPCELLLFKTKLGRRLLRPYPTPLFPCPYPPWAGPCIRTVSLLPSALWLLLWEVTASHPCISRAWHILKGQRLIDWLTDWLREWGRERVRLKWEKEHMNQYVTIERVRETSPKKLLSGNSQNYWNHRPDNKVIFFSWYYLLCDFFKFL